MEHNMKVSGVCSRSVSFNLEGDKVHDIEFIGGCNGNLKAISILCEGQTVDYIEEKLKGNCCGFRGTSCADQFAMAVRKAFEKENK